MYENYYMNGQAYSIFYKIITLSNFFMALVGTHASEVENGL